MRFLLVPFLLFCISWWVLWTVKAWSTKSTWRRIGLITATNLGAFVVTFAVIGFIVTFFN